MVKIFKGVPYSGTLPAVLTGTKAGYLHGYKVYGNMTQNGTPTPSDPIYPSECGERTVNIWTLTATDFSESTVVVGAAKEVTITGLTPNTQYTLTSNIRKTDSDVSCLWFNGTSPTNGVWNEHPRTSRSSANGELKVYYRSVNLPEFDNYWYMLNTGSTPLPYEPYGYKLPLLSGSTPVDIYLGESQTTRRIRKRVLTGEEYVGAPGNYPNHFYISVQDGLDTANLTTIAVSHYEAKNNATLSNLLRYLDGTACFRTGNDQLWFRDDRFTSNTDFKAFLTQQYANGTPVTVWYILATEETGTLNEPLRKIGDYADTLDSTQTTAQIPTSANSTTISWAGSGLAPSQFDSIAEWVGATPKIYTNGAWTDAQTYTYDDGAWVADNSN